MTTAYFDVPALAHTVATSLRRLLDGRDLDPSTADAAHARLIVREST